MSAHIIGPRELHCWCGHINRYKVTEESNGSLRKCRNRKCDRRYRIVLRELGQRWQLDGEDGRVLKISFEAITDDEYAPGETV